MEKSKEGINIENNTEKIDFEDLRHQVELMQKEEMIKKEKGENYDSHFDFIEPSVLTEKELIIFDKFLKKILTEGEFFDYKVSGGIDDPHVNFKGYLGNQLQHKENLKWFDPAEYEIWENIEKNK